MDWSLRACGRKGHVTFAPSEPELRDRLHTKTPVGEAWRCLRCGTFVLGEPKGSGPAEDAPIVLRGRALRDAFVLRLLAAERLLRGVAMGLGSWAVLRYAHSENALRTLFEKDLPAARPLANVFGYDLDHSSIVREIRKLLLVKQSTLHLVAVALAIYAAIELGEAIGLWLLKRWGEYFAAVATAIFLPYELYELVDRVTVIRVGAFIINIAAVVYLLLTKRLFGLRGGHAAYEAERHEASLLEVEEAAETSQASTSSDSTIDPAPSTA
ncbi:MAG TPA: DUF2127 domain-containing protein [Acidothermaceae bacterium]|nr:DUF2127 domain-containing protein [Acidothermaceae bacterium]